MPAFAVPHRRADIQDQMADEVRLHLVLLDEVLIARVVDAPVDVLGIIADHVLAVSGELHGEARQGRLVRTGQIADYESARLDRPLRHVAEHFWIEIAGEYTFEHISFRFWILKCSNFRC